MYSFVCWRPLEGELCSPKAVKVPEVMHCVLLCMPKAVEGGSYLLQVSEVSEVLVGDALYAALSAGGAGGDAPYATLYSGRC